MNYKYYTISILCLVWHLTAYGNVTLPRLISDGMVLQRDQTINVWGWAAAHEKVSVTFKGKTYRTTADETGKWSVALDKSKAGGPFTMEIKGINQLSVSNILIGDVWVCSGQSNMELTMERLKDTYSTLITTAKNPNIRQFLVPDQYDFKQEQHDLAEGGWVSVTPQTIFSFSAVAYFFAKDLYEKYNVPIGLINAALGGSPAEAWLSEDALKKFPDLYAEVQRLKDDALIESIQQRDRQQTKAWFDELNRKEQQTSLHWRTADFDDSNWNEMIIPGYWKDPVDGINASVWVRKKVTVPKSFTGKQASLWIGRIIDSDSAFVNGKFVGNTTYQYPPRKYTVPADLLKEGENTIVVKVVSPGGRGGFVLDKPYFLAVGSDTLPLTGAWKFNVSAIMPSMKATTTLRFKPAGLFNKMIAPLLPYTIKGVIWYQGESNTGNATLYRELFPAVINTWRERWNQGDFPFLFVQLTNLNAPNEQPVESGWATLREAQRKTLALPHTAMAVTVDIGEWNDIHPLNKLDVGKRLSLAAQKVAYHNKHVIASGPVYESYRTIGNKIIITFQKSKSKLISKGELKHISIAGADNKFVWANAKIEKNTLIVWSDAIANPVTVRYAWADNPVGATLYNEAGLPASPFTTEK